MTNLSIQPSQLEIQLKPSANYVQSYVIKNNGDVSVTLNTSVDTWLPQGPNGNIIYLNSPPNLNISLSNSDLKLGQNFILNPNQSKQLVLKIQGDTPGDYYFTFFVNQDVSPNPSTNSTQLIRLGSHLLVSISDSELPTANFKINNFKVQNPFIDCFFSSIKFSGEIQNNSNYFDKINQTINITKNNTIVNELTIFPDNVLAHHSRTLRCLDNKSPVSCQLSKPLWPGIYRASIDNTSTSFIVLPYSLLTFLLLLIVVTKLLIDKKNNIL